MTDTQKEVLVVLMEILPKMSKESQNYLLGYGEGMAMAYREKRADPAEEKDIA